MKRGEAESIMEAVVYDGRRVAVKTARAIIRTMEPLVEEFEADEVLFECFIEVVREQHDGFVPYPAPMSIPWPIK